MTYDRTNVIERDVAQAETYEFTAWFASVMALAGLCTVDEWSRWPYTKREFALERLYRAFRYRQRMALTVEELKAELAKRVF